jgi:hypothetical protein
MLIIFSPARNREHYFIGLSKLTRDGRRPTEEELLYLMTRYDQYELSMDGTVPDWGRH